MRNPIRSESDAFSIAMGTSALIAAALVWELGTKDPQRRRPLREPASELIRTHVVVQPGRAAVS